MARRSSKRTSRKLHATRPRPRAQHRSPVPPAVRPPVHNLPTQLTSFVGREREIAEVKRLLRRTRLLTLTGSGGCGKTRLALRVAAGILKRYPDGVWFVDLGPLVESVLVPQAVAAAVGVRNHSSRPLLDVLRDYLRSRCVLLVVDN